MQPYQMSIDEVLRAEQTNVTTGLSSEDAAHRLKLHGPNELPAKKGASALMVFLSQFTSPLMFILVIATALSLLVG